MVNGLHLYSAFIPVATHERFTIITSAFTHTQTLVSTVHSNGQVVGSSYGKWSAQGPLNTRLGVAVDGSRHLLVANQPTLPP